MSDEALRERDGKRLIIYRTLLHLKSQDKPYARDRADTRHSPNENLSQSAVRFTVLELFGVCKLQLEDYYNGADSLRRELELT